MIPVLCEIGPFAVYSYGVATAAALALAAWLAARRASLFGFERGRAMDAVFLLFIAGVIGSRLFFVLQHLDGYRVQPLRILDLRQGGLVWYGGLLVAFGAAFAIVDAFRWPRWKFGDFIAPVLSAGHAAGRIGCFLNGCCYGRPAWLPVQLLEAALLAGLAVYLWKKTGRVKRDGDLFLLYVLIYSFGRFWIEFLRADQERYGFLSVPQMTSLALFAAAWVVWKIRHGRKV